MILYLDSSAVLKLLIQEEGTAMMEDLFDGAVSNGQQLISSQLLHTEVNRVAYRAKLSSRSVEEVLGRISFLLPTVDTFLVAGRLPVRIKTLDALHIATIVEANLPEVSLVSFDQQMTTAADTLGIATLRPPRD